MTTRVQVLNYVLAISLFRIRDSDGFVRTATMTRHHVAPYAVNLGTQYSELTTEQIAICQQNAEAVARENVKLRDWNALFLPVPEQPEPVQLLAPETNDEWSTAATNTDLPIDFPPGCLLRLGPNGAPSEDGFLDGDGMIHCITFPPPSAAHVGNMYSATYVETQGRTMEKLRNKRYKGSLGAAPRSLPMIQNLISNIITFRSLLGQKDTANTALAEHNGRILALMEQSLPSEISVHRNGRIQTIEARTSLNGAIPNDNPLTGGGLAAHGRTCPTTGERIHVSYSSSSAPYIRVDVFSPEELSSQSSNLSSNPLGGWLLKRSIPVDLPNGLPVMHHDCAITENYVLVLDFPLTLRTSRFLQDRFPIEYEPENGARIGLVPRNDDNENEVRWFDCKPGVILHTINAYEVKDENVVVFQALRSEPRGTDSFIQTYATTFLHEWILDLDTGTTEERCLNPSTLVDFPVIDDSLIGKPTDAVYCATVSKICNGLKIYKTPQEGIMLGGVVKLALQNDELRRIRKGDVLSKYTLPQNWHSVSEPTVVRKINGGTGTYVIFVATRVIDKSPSSPVTAEAMREADFSMKSKVIVLDGDRLDEVVFAWDLPYRVPYGLHSMFLDWEKMK